MFSKIGLILIFCIYASDGSQRILVGDFYGRLQVLSAEKINLVNLTTIKAHNDFIDVFDNSTQPGYINHIKQLSNGLIATASDDGSIKLWQSFPKKPYIKLFKTLLGHRDYVYALTEVNASVFVSGSCDGTMKFWNSKSGAHLKTLTVKEGNPKGYSQCVSFLQMLPDGRLAMATYNETFVDGYTKANTNITFWNLTDYSSIIFAQLPSFVLDMKLTLNDTVLAVATFKNCVECKEHPLYDMGSIWLFDILTSDRLFVLGDTGLSNDQDLTDHPGNFHTSGVSRLHTFSDFMLASASFDGTVKLWNLNSIEDLKYYEPVTFDCQFNSTLTVNNATSADGTPLLVAGSSNGLIGVYSLKEGENYGHLMSSYNTGLDVTAVLVLNESDN